MVTARLAAISAALVLATLSTHAVAASHPSIDLTRLHVNQTTYSQVLYLYGAPSSDIRNSDGSRTIVYQNAVAGPAQRAHAGLAKVLGSRIFGWAKATATNVAKNAATQVIYSHTGGSMIGGVLAGASDKVIDSTADAASEVAEAHIQAAGSFVECSLDFDASSHYQRGACEPSDARIAGNTAYAGH